METLEALIRDYGYWAIFIGTLFEGETIYLLGAYAASLEWLKIEYVFLAGFTGTFISDQAVFLIARRYGPGLVVRYPIIYRRVQRLTPYLERWNTWFILGFRFVYGIRNLAAVAVALTSIPAMRFFWLNLIAALVWAIGFVAIGYLAGFAVREFVGDVKAWEHRIVGAVVLIIIVWSLGRLILRRTGRRKP
jgi:membrane protein DedA with SNARE-associated domain